MDNKRKSESFKFFSSTQTTNYSGAESFEHLEFEGDSIMETLIRRRLDTLSDDFETLKQKTAASKMLACNV